MYNLINVCNKYFKTDVTKKCEIHTFKKKFILKYIHSLCLAALRAPRSARTPDPPPFRKLKICNIQNILHNSFAVTNAFSYIIFVNISKLEFNYLV